MLGYYMCVCNDGYVPTADAESCVGEIMRITYFKKIVFHQYYVWRWCQITVGRSAKTCIRENDDDDFIIYLH